MDTADEPLVLRMPTEASTPATLTPSASTPGVVTLSGLADTSNSVALSASGGSGGAGDDSRREGEGNSEHKDDHGGG